MRNTLLFLLEEKSSACFLKQIIARLHLREYYDIQFRSFSGKSDLELKLEKTIRLWQVPNTQFIIMRDADSGNCDSIKQGLIDKCNQSGKGDYCIVRIACQELESFYLGDLAAVGRVYSIPNLESKQLKRKYRNPDTLGSPSEELKRLTNNLYSKVLGSTRIGFEITLDDTNHSPSFCTLLRTLLNFKSAVSSE